MKQKRIRIGTAVVAAAFTGTVAALVGISTAETSKLRIENTTIQAVAIPEPTTMAADLVEAGSGPRTTSIHPKAPGVEIRVGYSTSSTGRIHIVSCEDLVTPHWVLAQRTELVSGGGEVAWTDAATDTAVRFYTARSAEDTDSDGLPNWWEQQYGLDAESSRGISRADADGTYGDADDDAFLNIYEYLWGSDPTDADSTPDPTWYVDSAAPAGGDGSQQEPFNTIQEAIDGAGLYDYAIIQLADGVYKGPGNKDLHFGGRALMVRSTSGPENCIIDCERAGRGISFIDYEPIAAVLAGIQIRNGRVFANHKGGGIYCENGSPRTAKPTRKQPAMRTRSICRLTSSTSKNFNSTRP